MLALFVFLSGCKKENMGDCLKAVGNQLVETRLLEPFTRMEVEDGVTVVFRFDENHRAVVTAGENLIDLIETEVQAETLYIRNRNVCNWVRALDTQISVIVYCTELKELISRGYGTIESGDTISQPFFAVEQWDASSTIRLTLNTQEVYILSHTGPADYFCTGQSDFLYAYNSSMGILRLEEVAAQEVQVWNRGVGDIHVNASQKASILIDRVGDVYYHGNPTELEITENSTGKAIPVN
ncbi:MAG: DUF2807 domain-containing protein [Cryomorphaceae bacterium]|nr:MAG: DUF2807 domain-containing protein [Cryomorphaceae bacterium]